ncbi:uncharacterized protein LOC120946241 [Rana temporaria]|uniref:uncharacterized protein LOC120946241 n=1 Tax=Rana temporaria TaxID=8407 RepID=UPI001AADA20A|nr:uncharacterized protein LOC120946241 [Rana temporaria]
MSLFIGVLISLCFLQVAVALPHANLPYENVEVRAGSKLVIPCDLTTDGVTGNEKIDFEWGFTPDGSDRYRTIMRRSDVKLHPEVPPELGVHLYPTHPIQEDCSLVINPILMEDSGTYEIKVIVNSAQRGPIRKTKVHVTDSPLMTAGKKFSARRTAMVQFLEPITTAEEEQTAGMEEGQARPVVEGQTTGKKLNAKRKPMVHGPVTATIQTAIAAEEQTAKVDKEPKNHGQNTGKKLDARRKPVADRPMTTTIQKTPVAKEQTATVDKEPRNHGQTTGKKLDARRNPVADRPMTTTIHKTPVAKEQTAKVDKEPKNHGQTTGKKLDAKRKPVADRPMTTTIQKTPVAKEQTATVDKEPKNHGQTTGKKLDARRKPVADRPMTTTIQKTPVAKEQTATVDKEPKNHGQTTGKKLDARRKPVADRPMTTTIQKTPVAEEQTAKVDKEPKNHGQTTGKKLDARRKPVADRPMTTTIQKTPVAKEQTAKVDKEPKNHGQTTGKKLDARRMPVAHHPMTTTIQKTPVAKEQTATVDKEPIRSRENNILQYVILWWYIVQFPRKYVTNVAIVISAVLFLIIGIYCLGRAVHIYRKNKFETRMGSKIKEERLVQDEPRQDGETGPLEYRGTVYEFKVVVVE